MNMIVANDRDEIRRNTKLGYSIPHCFRYAFSSPDLAGEFGNTVYANYYYTPDDYTADMQNAM